MRIVIIVPFHNEERYLGEALDSVAAQTRPPDRLILVDDGSDDGSYRLAEDFARDHPYATVLRRPPRPPGRDRLAAASELLAFQWAVDGLDEPWDVVAKIDADVRLTAGLLATIEQRLEEDPTLGLAGSFLSEAGSGGALVRLRIRDEHVHGATKFYRRDCYEDIAPIPAFLGWDMIDEVRARMRGWRTASFAMPGGDPIHLRPRGTHDGLLQGFRRWGRGAYATGEHPLHVVLHSALRCRERPPFLGGANYFLGWVLAAVSRAPRAEPELRSRVRQEQMRRIRRRVSGRAARPPGRSEEVVP